MGRARLICALLLLLCFTSPAHAVQNILYVGNSITEADYTTSVNRMPARVTAVLPWAIGINAGCGSATAADFIAAETQDHSGGSNPSWDNDCPKKRGWPIKIVPVLGTQNVVHIMFGVGDAYSAQEPCSNDLLVYTPPCYLLPHQYYGALQGILDGFPDTQRFVLSTDPQPIKATYAAADVTTVGPDGRNYYQRMAAFRDMAVQFASQRPNVCFGVDMMTVLNESSAPSLFEADEIHPSVTGLDAMAVALAARLAALFDTDGPLYGQDPCMHAIPDGQFFFLGG